MWFVALSALTLVRPPLHAQPVVVKLDAARVLSTPATMAGQWRGRQPRKQSLPKLAQNRRGPPYGGTRYSNKLALAKGGNGGLRRLRSGAATRAEFEGRKPASSQASKGSLPEPLAKLVTLLYYGAYVGVFGKMVLAVLERGLPGAATAG